MSDADSVKVYRAEEIDVRLRYIADRLKDWDYKKPCAITLKPYSNPRTISQNAMFHSWCRYLSAAVNKRDASYTEENVKLLLKQLFLALKRLRLERQSLKTSLGRPVI